MDNENKNKIDQVLYLIINLSNFEKTANRYYQKWKSLDEYTGVKSIRMDNIIVSGEGKTNVDIIMEKDKCYSDYMYFKAKAADVKAMLDILESKEKDIIVGWYTTPKQYRKNAYDFAREHDVSRAEMFRIKKDALQKLITFS